MSLILGIVLVRVLLGYGVDAYGLYALVITGFGLSIIVREWLRVALLPGLIEAYHEKNRGDPLSAERIADAQTIAYAFGLCAFALFFMIAGLVVWMLLDGAWSWLPLVFVMIRAVYALSSIWIYPTFLGFLARRQQVRLNIVLLIERVIEVGSAQVIALMALPGYESLALFAALSTTGTMAFHLFIAFRAGHRGVSSNPILNILRREREHIWAGFRDILAPMLYFRFDLIVLSVVFGPAVVAVMALGVQIVGYVRQISLAMVQGADAVFANYALHHDDAGNSSDRYFGRMVFLQAVVVLFVVGGFALFRDDLISIWLGDHLATLSLGESMLPLLVLLLLPGALAGSVSQAWTTMMTGAGALPKFVGLLLKIAFLNPLIVGFATLLWARQEETALIVVSLTFSGLTVLGYLVMLPRRLAQIRQVPTETVLRPLAIPFLALFGAAAATFAVQSQEQLPEVAAYVVYFTAFVVLIAVLTLGAEFLRKKTSARRD